VPSIATDDPVASLPLRHRAVPALPGFAPFFRSIPQTKNASDKSAVDASEQEEP
jgi:hypothetical protein